MTILSTPSTPYSNQGKSLFIRTKTHGISVYCLPHEHKWSTILTRGQLITNKQRGGKCLGEFTYRRSSSGSISRRKYAAMQPDMPPPMIAMLSLSLPGDFKKWESRSVHKDTLTSNASEWAWVSHRILWASRSCCGWGRHLHRGSHSWIDIFGPIQRSTRAMTMLVASWWGHSLFYDPTCSGFLSLCGLGQWSLQQRCWLIFLAVSAFPASQSRPFLRPLLLFTGFCFWATCFSRPSRKTFMTAHELTLQSTLILVVEHVLLYEHPESHVHTGSVTPSFRACALQYKAYTVTVTVTVTVRDLF
jgi:hypothetical protein